MTDCKHAEVIAVLDLTQCKLTGRACRPWPRGVRCQDYEADKTAADWLAAVVAEATAELPPSEGKPLDPDDLLTGFKG